MPSPHRSISFDLSAQIGVIRDSPKYPISPTPLSCPLSLSPLGFIEVRKGLGLIVSQSNLTRVAGSKKEVLLSSSFNTLPNKEPILLGTSRAEGSSINSHSKSDFSVHSLVETLSKYEMICRFGGLSS